MSRNHSNNTYNKQKVQDLRKHYIDMFIQYNSIYPNSKVQEQIDQIIMYILQEDIL